MLERQQVFDSCLSLVMRSLKRSSRLAITKGHCGIKVLQHVMYAPLLSR